MKKRAFYLSLLLVLGACSSSPATNGPGPQGTTGDGGTAADGGPGGSDGGTGGGPCAATLHNLVYGVDKIPLMAIDSNDVLYIVPWKTHNSVYSIDLHTGSGKVVYTDPDSTSLDLAGNNERLIVKNGALYFGVGDKGIVRLDLATGVKTTLMSLPNGGLTLRGNYAYYSNVNGEVRRIDLSQPSTGTIVYKKGLSYQLGELVAGTAGMTILGTANGSSAVFHEGTPKATLFAGGNEYLTNLNADDTYAYFLADHLNGTTHDGVGRVALDGSSAKKIQWLTGSNDHQALRFGQGGMGGPVPLTADSVIVAVEPVGSNQVSIKRINRTTLAECTLGTFPSATGTGSALAYAAGPHSFAWYASDKSFHWYLLP